MSTRSLADALRAAPDEVLEALLLARPDLTHPVPTDLAQLAARATTSSSVARAMDRLDRWTLQVLEAACVHPEPVPPPVLHQLIAADTGTVGDVETATDRLLALALLWTDGAGLRVVVAARELFGPQPCGLGPPRAQLPAASAASVPDARQVLDLVSRAPAGVVDLLDRLMWGPPTGTVERADRIVDVDTAESPVDWLLAHGLLVPTGASTVVLPREVALALRGGRALAHPQPRPPVIPAVHSREPARVDDTAGQQAFTFARAVEDLLEAWSVEPPSVLRAGGIGVRELRRAAALLDVEEWAAALVIETAHAAGLLAVGGEMDARWLPTPAYDLWRARDTDLRWAGLADAWLRTTRVAGLVGHRDRDKALAALGPELDRVLAPEVRRGTLDALKELAPGTVPDPEAIVENLTWHRPRRPHRLRSDLVGWTVREAEHLGITGLGALAAPGRALIEDGVEAAADALLPLLPQPLDHVLLQADLTAVAPGPLETGLARELALMADVESTGGATVFRFSPASVRRALDAGRSAAELQALLLARSRTPVPQPLAYLVDDMARRHGRIRVGVASAYVRADDEEVLGQLLAERRAADLRLRRLAPTVLAAQAPVDLVLDRLRAMGYAPAAETPEGDVLVRRPDARRSPAGHRAPRLVTEPAVPTRTMVAAAVRALRAGERASHALRGPLAVGTASSAAPRRTGTAEILALLRSALDNGRSVWIGYADTQGGVVERVIDPVRLAGGYLTAYDHRYAEVHSFAVHRITGAAELAVGATD